MEHLERPGISVVLPMYNEAENVKPLLTEIANSLRSWAEYEIVVVDDCSSDDTLAQLRELKKTMPQLSIVHHVKNAGQTAAVISGVRAAHHDIVATLDGDGQNPPANIKLLYDAWKNSGVPMIKVLVAGHRHQRKDDGLRRFSSRFANKVRQCLLKDDCPDSGCGLKLFARNRFLRLPLFKNAHRFLPALFHRAGCQLINVKIEHRDRERGISKYGVWNRLWVGIVDLFGVAWLIRRPVDVEVEYE